MSTGSRTGISNVLVPLHIQESNLISISELRQLLDIQVPEANDHGRK